LQSRGSSTGARRPTVVGPPLLHYPTAAASSLPASGRTRCGWCRSPSFGPDEDAPWHCTPLRQAIRLMPILGADAKEPCGCVPRVSSGREAAIWEGAVQVDRSLLDHVQLHGFLEGNGGWIQTRVRICCRPVRVRRCARRRDSVLVEVRRR